MRCVAAASIAACLSTNLAAASPACGPEALGTSRVLVVDPAEHGRVGTMSYAESVPLSDKEVVLTFDDGPLPPYTGTVLDALAAECVKATFFIVGRMARAYPEWVRRIYNEGHTIGTHSYGHPMYFRRLSLPTAVSEIDRGIAEAETALGDPAALAPFYRFPGLGSSRVQEQYLAARGIMTWSADFPADDWHKISAEEVTARALRRLEHKGRGILLLHDIQPRTALALPTLLRELKARGYRIVHVVPAGPARPPLVAEPATPAAPQQASVLTDQRPAPHQYQPFASRARRGVWPRVAKLPVAASSTLPVPSAMSFGFPHLFEGRYQVAGPEGSEPTIVARENLPTSLRRKARARLKWPAVTPVYAQRQQVIVASAMPGAEAISVAPSLPAPGLDTLDLRGSIRPDFDHAQSAWSQPAARAGGPQRRKRPATRPPAQAGSGF